MDLTDKQREELRLGALTAIDGLWFLAVRAGETVPCEMIDNTIFIHWLREVDPSIHMEITHSLPRGDDHCAWTLTRSV